MGAGMKGLKPEIITGMYGFLGLGWRDWGLGIGVFLLTLPGTLQICSSPQIPRVNIDP